MAASRWQDLETLAHTKKELKVLMQKQRRAEGRKSRHGLSQFAVQTVLAAYVLCGHDAKLAGVLAKRQRRPLKGDEEEDPDFPSLVEDLYLDASADALLQIHFPTSAFYETTCLAGKKFLAEADVLAWVRSQNFQHGVAPTSLAAAAQYAQAISGRHGPQDLVLKPRGARRWVQRWARRWGVRRRKLDSQPTPLPPEIILQKVPRGLSC